MTVVDFIFENFYIIMEEYTAVVVVVVVVVIIIIVIVIVITVIIIIRGNRNFTALKVPSQCPLVLVKVGWKQGKAFGSDVLGGGLLAVGSEGRS